MAVPSPDLGTPYVYLSLTPAPTDLSSISRLPRDDTPSLTSRQQPDQVMMIFIETSIASSGVQPLVAAHAVSALMSVCTAALGPPTLPSLPPLTRPVSSPRLSAGEHVRPSARGVWLASCVLDQNAQMLQGRRASWTARQKLLAQRLPSSQWLLAALWGQSVRI
jgi:hypothetical protein